MNGFKRIMNRWGSVVALFLVLGSFPSTLPAQYVISRGVFDMAGEKRSSSAYELIDVVGQTVIGTSTSALFTLQSGILAFGRQAVGIAGEPGGGMNLPRAYALTQNYPNPFNPSTTIRFDIPERAGMEVPVRLAIYNIRGQHVRTLVEGKRDPGTYTVHWDGRDGNGVRASSGIYLYHVVAGEYTAVRKMVMVK